MLGASRHAWEQMTSSSANFCAKLSTVRKEIVMRFVVAAAVIVVGRFLCIVIIDPKVANNFPEEWYVCFDPITFHQKGLTIP
jgi:hypothetical protein